jgi:hypothetical protein
MTSHLTRSIPTGIACALVLTAPSFATEPTPNTRTILLVDDHDVLYRTGTQRILTPFKRHAANPVLAETKPWEIAIAWCSIYRNPDTGKYQLWYQAYAAGVAKRRTHTCVTCYAESDDGITFRKPNLGLFDIAGIKDTNIVLIGAGGHSTRYCNSVVVDPNEKDPARRYKMTYFDFGIDNGKEYPGLHVAFSPDGIHWTKHTKTPIQRVSYGNFGDPIPFEGEKETRPWDVPLSMSDAMDVMIDPKRKVFAAYGKMWIDGPDGGMYFKHGMGRIESKDFINWSKPQLILAPDDFDPPWVEFHTSSVFFHDDVYFCLNQILDRATGGGVIDVELALSRDGINFQRPFRNQFVLPRAKGDGFDSGSIFTNATPVILEDEIRFYYGAYSMGATGADDKIQRTGIGLATIPRDRFGGIQPVEKSDQPTLRKPLKNIGQITLKPLNLKDVERITLNADASSGSIQVELLKPNLRRLRGLNRSNAASIKGDSLTHKVTWKEKELSDLKTPDEVHLNNATLYALTLHKPPTDPQVRSDSHGSRKVNKHQVPHRPGFGSASIGVHDRCNQNGGILQFRRKQHTQNVGKINLLSGSLKPAAKQALYGISLGRMGRSFTDEGHKMTLLF